MVMLTSNRWWKCCRHYYPLKRTQNNLMLLMHWRWRCVIIFKAVLFWENQVKAWKAGMSLSKRIRGGWDKEKSQIPRTKKQKNTILKLEIETLCVLLSFFGYWNLVPGSFSRLLFVRTHLRINEDLKVVNCNLKTSGIWKTFTLMYSMNKWL